MFQSPTIFYIYSGGFSLFFTLMTTVFSIYHLDMVRLNPFQLVLVGTILEATCFFFEIPTGVLADYYSRRLSLVVGLVVMGIGIFIEGYFPVFLAVAGAQVVWGIGATFLSGADVAWIADEMAEKEKLGEVLLKSSQIRQIATLLGIFISIGLAGIRLNLPILVSGVCFILLGGFLFGFMLENNFKPTRRLEQKARPHLFLTFREGLTMVKKNTLVKALFFTALLGGLFSEGYDRLWTFRFLKELRLPDLGQIQPLYWFAVISTGAVLLNLVVLHYIKKGLSTGKPVSILWVLFFVNLVLTGGIFFFALAGNFYLALGIYWLVYAMRGANGPLLDLLLNHEITRSQIRATVLSMRGQVDQAGQIIGGPLIGWIATRWSVPVGIGAAAIFLVPVAGIYYYIQYKVRKNRIEK